MKPTIYIAGPMTGIPEFNYPVFRDAQARLEAAGYTVLNPVSSHLEEHAPQPGAAAWPDFMRNGINQLIRASGIAMLPGWQESRGATLEHTVAAAIGMQAADVEEWIQAAAGIETRVAL